MAATTTLLGLVTPTQGTLTGTWGDTVNYGITDYVDIAIAGTLAFAGDGAITLANTTGSSSGNSIGATTAQYAIIRVTGTLTTAKIITGPSYSKTYLVVNAATGSTVTFKASGQTGVSIAVGETALVYYNGTDYVKVVGTATAGAAGGSTTQVQYNNAGVLAGITGATTNGTALTLVAPVLGTPASGTVTNLTGTASININGTVGATTATTGAFTTLTTSSTVTHNGGTANAVAYLNGSKVLTTGTALTFDGTNLVNTSSSVGTPEIVVANSATSAGANARLRIKAGANGASTVGDAFLQFTDNLNWNWSIGAGSSTSNALTFNQYFGLGTNELMRLSSTGLAVTGALSATGTLSGGTSGTAYSFSGSAPATSLTLDSSGNLGVGTSSPAQTLHLKSETSANVQFEDTTSGTAGYVGPSANNQSDTTAQRLGIRGEAGVSFSVGAATKMTLDSSGNLGLGVTPQVWSSIYDAFQIGAQGAFWANATANDVISSANLFLDVGHATKYITNGYASYYSQNAGSHTWAIAPNNTSGAGAAATFTSAMTLDASGNLGIGTTSPLDKLDVVSAGATYRNRIRNSGGNEATLLFQNSNTGTAGSDGLYLGILGSMDAYLWNYENNPIIFGTNNTAQMRLDSSGNLLVGGTSVVLSSKFLSQFDGSTHNGAVLNETANTASTTFLAFSLSGTAIGAVARVGATSAVIYNTTSDQRLKSNIQTAAPVLEKLMQVQVRQYDWTVGDLHQEYGFIAQELEPVLSGVVTKGKTEEDMWQLDYSRLTPHLVKAIQELKAEFDAYKASHP